LPSAIGHNGWWYSIKKMDDFSTTLTIATQLGQTIDGDTTLTVVSQYTAPMIVSDGANWVIV
jgi:hypothetical protein